MLAARCAEVQAALEELRGEEAGAYLIVIEDTARGYYAQFVADETSFWCETVSNEFLEPPNVLDDDQMSRLASLGWSPPAGKFPNWWYAGDTSTAAGVAAATVQALRDVYRVGLDEPFKLEKSWT